MLKFRKKYLVSVEIPLDHSNLKNVGPIFAAPAITPSYLFLPLNYLTTLLTPPNYLVIYFVVTFPLSMFPLLPLLAPTSA